MKTITATDLRLRWSEALESVDSGAHLIVTRHGTPVARLVPVEQSPRMTPEEAMAAIRAIRARVTLGGDSVRSLIDEGRR